MPPKAILLVDNCTAHEELKSDDGNIIIVALPPNVTAVLQPMDQSPIKVTKMKYRKLLLHYVVTKENAPIEKTLKEHTIRDAIVMLKDAWEDIPDRLLQRAWSKIRDWDKDHYTEEDLEPLSTLQTQPDYYGQIASEVETLLNQMAPRNDAPRNDVTMQEIEEWNIDAMGNAELEDVESSDSEEEATAEAKISHLEAIDNANNLIKWCSQNEECGLKHTFNLMNIRSDIVTLHVNKDMKQKTITEYFK